MSWEPIAARVQEVIGEDLGRLAEQPSAEEIDRWRTRLNEEAEQAAGFAWATYLRSKVSSVVDRYARTICRLSDYPEDCNQATFVREVLRRWAEGRLFADRDGHPAPAEDQVAFLRTFDLEYGARRLRFVIDGLSWWYRHCDEESFPTRAELNEGKRRLYEAQDVLTDAMDGKRPLDGPDRRGARRSSARTRSTTGSTPRSAARRTTSRRTPRRSRSSSRSSARASTQRSTASANTSSTACSRSPRAGRPPRKEDILVRFLGFPIWDSLLYPHPVDHGHGRAGLGRHHPDEPARRQAPEAARPGQAEAERRRDHALRRVLQPRRAARTTTSGAASTARSG